ncbi:MAG TPA: D-glycero-beta-D-manno-heptose-7-phosphate kinase [candidate division Zixibacteria bacterium]|nr:D-glycero-beta-D-manno-heptose-7-phosphate kinase [candidate division Zixibacteria bacterium]
MALTAARVDEITAGMGRARIMIVGDIMLDEYWFGSVSRISPEAPVPVVEITSSKQLLGGAANVAANIRTLGDEVVLLGAVGNDEAGGKLTALLNDRSISDDYLILDKSRQTTIKTRVIAHSQQVVRTDRENRHSLDEPIEKKLLDRFMSMIDRVDAVIISDYGKGVITPTLLEAVIQACSHREKFVAVDPKETNFPNYRNVSLITPNHHEAGFAYGRRIQNEQDLLEVGNGLLDRLQARSILITRGPDGMSLFQKDVPPTHIPTFAREVYDVTGAGDTVIATFVSSVAAKANLVEAAIVANTAAGITIAEIGTASVSLPRLSKGLKQNVLNGNLVSAGIDN